MATLHNVFLENVKRRLGELDITQRDLAERMKVTEAYVSQIISGRNVPSLLMVERVAVRLETTAQYLLTPVAPEENPISLGSGVDVA